MRTLSLLSIALLAPTILLADEAELREELRKANERLDALETRFGASSAETNEEIASGGASDEDVMGYIRDLQGKLRKGLVMPGNSGATVVFNGRIHMDYWGFPDTDYATSDLEGERPQARFGFRRVRFGAKGEILKGMVYKIEVEFADPDDIEWRDAFIGFQDLPVLGTILFGNQKRPYGWDHWNSSRYNVFIERPFVVEAFNQDSRRFGAQSYNYTEDEMWNWQVGVFLGDRIQDSDAFYVSNHLQGEIAGRFAGTPWYEDEGRNYWHVGVASSYAMPDGDDTPVSTTGRFLTRPEARTSGRWLDTGDLLGANGYELVAVENVLNIGPLQLTNEIQSVFVQRRRMEDLCFWGGYASLSYFLTDDHMPIDRTDGSLDRIIPTSNFFFADRITGDDTEGCGWGAWQVAARYSYLDLSNADILGGVGHSVTFGLNWYWNPFSRMQFNYIHGWIRDQSRLSGRNDNAAEYDIVGVRFMVDF